MNKILIAAAGLALAGTASAKPPAPAPTPPSDITRAAAIADAERRFAALDKDGNGRLEAPELAQAAEQRRAERRRRMEERLGQMNAEERARFEQRRAARGGEERGPGRRPGGRGGSSATTLAEFRAQAEQRFDRLDLDRDGVITATEQAQLRARPGGRRD